MSRITTAAVLDALKLEEVGPDRYLGRNADIGMGVVFGGQLLAQTVTAALTGQDGKHVTTLQTVFARGARPEAPLDIVVERMASGRSVASSTVTVSQGDRICARSLVLMTAQAPDFVRHSDDVPAAEPPPEEPADGFEAKIVGDVDVDDPELVGPAELDVWTRWAGAPDDPGLGQALLAFATEGFLVGTAMRPHPGVGISQAHVTISTGVLGHTLTFHEPVRAADWLLLRHRSPHAGSGYSFGAADVYRADGTLVASFVQDGLLRERPAGSTGHL